MNKDVEEILIHYGVGHDKGGRSGRYPWGSGKNSKKNRGFSIYRNKDGSLNERGVKKAAKIAKKYSSVTGKNLVINKIKKEEPTQKEMLKAKQKTIGEMTLQELRAQSDLFKARSDLTLNRNNYIKNTAEYNSLTRKPNIIEKISDVIKSPIGSGLKNVGKFVYDNYIKEKTEYDIAKDESNLTKLLKEISENKYNKEKFDYQLQNKIFNDKYNNDGNNSKNKDVDKIVNDAIKRNNGDIEKMINSAMKNYTSSNKNSKINKVTKAVGKKLVQKTIKKFTSSNPLNTSYKPIEIRKLEGQKTITNYLTEATKKSSYMSDVKRKEVSDIMDTFMKDYGNVTPRKIIGARTL